MRRSACRAGERTTLRGRLVSASEGEQGRAGQSDSRRRAAGGGKEATHTAGGLLVRARPQSSYTASASGFSPASARTQPRMTTRMPTTSHQTSSVDLTLIRPAPTEGESQGQGRRQRSGQGGSEGRDGGRTEAAADERDDVEHAQVPRPRARVPERDEQVLVDEKVDDRAREHRRRELWVARPARLQRRNARPVSEGSRGRAGSEGDRPWRPGRPRLPPADRSGASPDCLEPARRR